MDHDTQAASIEMGFVSASEAVRELVEAAYRRHMTRGRGRTCPHPDKATLVCSTHPKMARCVQCAAEHKRSHSLQHVAACGVCGTTGLDRSPCLFGIGDRRVLVVLCPDCLDGSDESPPGPDLVA